MASKFAFSTATIGSTTITNAQFVYGKGILDESGWDVINTTADGANRRDRITKYGVGRMVLYGNQVALAHPATIPSLSFPIVLTSANGTSLSRTGVVTSARYSDAEQNTVVTFATDPIPPTSSST